MDRLTPKIRFILDRQTNKVNVFIVYVNETSDDQFWMSLERVGLLLETEPGTAFSLDTRNIETDDIKKKTVAHDGEHMGFSLEQRLIGYAPMSEIRFLHDLLKVDRTLREEESAAASEIVRALSSLKKQPNNTPFVRKAE